MKRLFLFAGIAGVLMVGPTAAKPIELGNTSDEVTASLGSPSGTAQIGNTTIYYYSFGEIVLLDGKVVSFRFRPAAAEADIRSHSPELKEQGERIKAAMLADQKFQATPSSYQVHFWREFQISYPDVPVREQLTAALTHYQREILSRNAVVDDNRRIRELELNIEAAERDAALAREEGLYTRRFLYPWPYFYGSYGNYYVGGAPFLIFPEHERRVRPVRPAGLVPLVPRPGDNPAARTPAYPSPHSGTGTRSVGGGGNLPSGTIQPVPATNVVPLVPRTSPSGQPMP